MNAAQILVRGLLVTSFALVTSLAQAQMTPVGLWKTIDDKTGSPKAEVRIVEKDGVVTGTIEKVYRADFNPTDKCGKCTDDRKDKLILGLEIMRGLTKADGKDVWEGGTIVDSESGTVYKAKVTPIDGGAKLEMRGFIGFALLGRTQTWLRVQ